VKVGFESGDWYVRNEKLAKLPNPQVTIERDVDFLEGEDE
jgi:hypothetical protein